MALYSGYIGKDVNELLYDYIVEMDALTQEEWEKHGFEYDEEWSTTYVNGADIRKTEIPYDKVWWDDYDYCDFIEEDLIAEAHMYLVFSWGCNWCGSWGYKFAPTFREAISRSYENTQRILGGSTHRKTLLLRESSHDILGSQVAVIGLTEKEYKRLESADFKVVQSFAQRHIREINEKRMKKGA